MSNIVGELWQSILLLSKINDELYKKKNKDNPWFVKMTSIFFGKEMCLREEGNSSGALMAAQFAGEGRRTPQGLGQAST